LVMEAIRNLVVGVLRALHSSSATPYPFSNWIFPSIPTSTAPRKEFLASSAVRYASARRMARFASFPRPCMDTEQRRTRESATDWNIARRIDDQDPIVVTMLPLGPVSRQIGYVAYIPAYISVSARRDGSTHRSPAQGGAACAGIDHHGCVWQRADGFQARGQQQSGKPTAQISKGTATVAAMKKAPTGQRLRKASSQPLVRPRIVGLCGVENR
jgi:hypothetical protein